MGLSTSDSASTQKRLNRLIEQCREADEEEFGPASTEGINLVENFCSMHLGVNLRKAFLSGVKDTSEQTSDSGTGLRDYHQVDTLVHEFCKLFGKRGTPEYACGVVMFPDFLALKSSDSSLSDEAKAYYSSCSKVTLERQVGNRYFVTAANATKILFLREAAIEFLLFTGRDNGNKLQRDVRVKERRERMLQAKERREAFQRRAEKERNELSKLHLIISAAELAEVLADIDEDISPSKKAKKLALLKTQVRIRKKVLKQNIHIVFTHSRKQRPLNEIVKELSLFITHETSPPAIEQDPARLVGKRIHHKFEVQEIREELWYYGCVIGYNTTTKLYEVPYSGKI